MPSDKTKQFAALFSKTLTDEVIPWVGNNDVGLTVIRQYPEGIAFIPARNKKNEIDTACMIKVGFSASELSNQKKLFGSVSKVSKYLLNGHYNYDFNDETSPTKDSLDESKASLQPIDLDITRYCFNEADNTFIDADKNNQIVSLNDIIEYAFKLHLKTIEPSGLLFRSKISLRDRITNCIEPCKKALLWILGNVFGKTLQPESRTSFSEGLFNPYKHNNLRSLADEQIDLFGTGIKIPRKSAYIAAFTLFIMTLIFTYFLHPLWWTEFKQQNQVVQLSFAVVFILIIDYFIPHFILLLINLLVRFRLKLFNWKIRIE